MNANLVVSARVLSFLQTLDLAVLENGNIEGDD